MQGYCGKGGVYCEASRCISGPCFKAPAATPVKEKKSASSPCLLQCALGGMQMSCGCSAESVCLGWTKVCQLDHT